MALFNRILVAVDISPETLAVLKKVAILAAENQAQLCVMHVANSPGSAYSQWALHKAPVSEQEIEGKLRDKFTELLVQAGLPGQEFEVVFGRPADVILDRAENYAAQLIVVGRNSRSGVRALLGSTASAIINRADCDVLALKTV